MAQCPVRLISTDDLERSITVAVNGEHVEYFLGDRYYASFCDLKQWLNAGWSNHAVAQLTARAHYIHTKHRDGRPTSNGYLKGRKEMISIEHQKTPSEEFSWTVIAPTAKSVCYNGERAWFKTQQDAEAFAASIYEGETKKNFDLAIVQCKNLVAPKPQIELSSRWPVSTAA